MPVLKLWKSNKWESLIKGGGQLFGFMFKQIKITSYNLLQTKIVQINEWKQVNLLLSRQADSAQFLNFSLAKY